jgi:hypothetical protein
MPDLLPRSSSRLPLATACLFLLFIVLASTLLTSSFYLCTPSTAGVPIVATSIGTPDLLSSLTVRIPLENYGFPGFVNEAGDFVVKFPNETRRVILEVGLHVPTFLCKLPALEPDLFVFAWEANEQSFRNVHAECFEASHGKYIAMPFAAASGDDPLSWNTNARVDPCASLALGDSKARTPEGWIPDPNARATERCLALEKAGIPLRLWDKPMTHDGMIGYAASMMGACLWCKNGHKHGANKLIRVPVLSLETVLRVIPPNITVEMAYIDAQGADLAVLKSAGSQMHRIKKVHLEGQDMPLDNPDFMYSGPLVANVSQTIDEMRRLGFLRYELEMNNCACLEYNMNFWRE